MSESESEISDFEGGNLCDVDSVGQAEFERHIKAVHCPDNVEKPIVVPEEKLGKDSISKSRVCKSSVGKSCVSRASVCKSSVGKVIVGKAIVAKERSDVKG